ncbi:MAG: signal peptidase II [Actinomycetota bacterium]|nr:signal peptidase II [Actinomycetota bacterium]
MQTATVHRTVAYTAVIVAAADQLTKLAGTLNVGGVFLPVHNPDYSLGVIAAPTVALIALSAVTLIAAARYGIGLARAGRIPTWVPGVIVGGAVSNLADRLVFGAVRDFIPTPVVIFNVADVAVLCGVVAFVWSMTRAPLTPAH